MDFRLILKKIIDKLSTAEQEEFDQWVSENKEHSEFFENVHRNIFKINNTEEINLEEKWSIFKKEVEKKSVKKYRNYWFASSFTALLIIVSFFYLKNPVTHNYVTTSEELQVELNKTVLVLSDGTQIFLNKEESFKSNNIQTNGDELVYKKTKSLKSEELVYNELIVPRGGDYKVMLSDGTEVWLNSDTKIRYPEYFLKDTPRIVELVYGEAFFKVIPIKDDVYSKEFQVKTADQTIHVLGTAFNVTNYAERNQIETTLVNGEVKLSTLFESFDLKPGFQAVKHNNSDNFEINAVNTDHIVAWIKGEYKFKRKSLDEIMLRISYWYDVQVVFESTDLKQIEFSGVFNKSQNLEVILNLLKQGNVINYELKDNKLFIKKPKDLTSL